MGASDHASTPAFSARCAGSGTAIARRRVHRPANRLIGSAAAQVAVHGFVDIGVGGIRSLGEQRRRGHDLTGLAVAALRHVLFDPGPLHRMAPSVGGKAFDGGDGFARHGSRSASRRSATGWPLIWTVQAPHCAMPQPNLVPVIPSVSRRTHSRGICGLHVHGLGFSVQGKFNDCHPDLLLVETALRKTSDLSIQPLLDTEIYRVGGNPICRQYHNHTS